MVARSAGILLYRIEDKCLKVMLVHPGGPFWAKKDDGAWSMPKGEQGPEEEPWATAVREFEEETGQRPAGDPLDLGDVVQSSRKRVHGFALEGELDVSSIKSCTFEMEWPPRSGRRQSFPEVDRAAWFSIEDAMQKIIMGQKPFLERLKTALAQSGRLSPRS